MEEVSTEAKMNSVENIVENCLVECVVPGSELKKKNCDCNEVYNLGCKEADSHCTTATALHKVETVIAPSQHEPVTVEREIKQKTEKKRRCISVLWKLQRRLEVAT